MKNQLLCGLLLMLSSLFSAAYGQDIPINEPDLNKPKLFADLPEKMPLQISVLEQALKTSEENSDIAIPLSGNFVFRGRVISKTSKYDGTIQSIVIRSSNRAGAIFNFSRIVSAGGEIIYRGRIVSLQHGDLLDITYENGQYTITRKNYYDLINE